MKKIIAALLCFLMILSLFSCRNKSIEDINYNPDNSTSSNASDNPTANNTSANYDSVLRVYRRIVDSYPIVNQNPRALAAEFGIQDDRENEAFIRLYSSIHQFYPGRWQDDSLSPHYKLKCGYAIKDINRDGVDELVLLTDDYRIIAVCSLVNGIPVLLGNYIKEDIGCTCRNWIDAEGRIHVVRAVGGDLYHHSISEISNGQLIELCTYGHDVFRENGEVIGKLYQTINEKTTFITEQDINELNRQYKNPLNADEAANITKDSAGFTFTSLYTEAEIAMEMYEAAINNEIKVYETDIQEYNYLADCKTPYNRIPLADCEQLKYAYTNMDNDSINELVIDCGDTLLLRYYEGMVYVYSFTFRNLYDLNTDGSYSWNHTGQDFEHGEKQIYFEGTELKAKELYRIVNDGEPNAEYYVEGKPVTQEELQKYIEDNPKTQLVFLPLEVSWQNKISQSEAIKLAEEYWETEDGFTDYGAGSMWICHIILLDDMSSVENGYYHIGLQVDHYGRDGNDLRVLFESSMEHLFVNAVTGECHEYVPILGNGTPFYGKG